MLLGEIVKPNQTFVFGWYYLFAGGQATGGGGDGVKRELIESCPDLPEHLVAEHEEGQENPQDQQSEHIGCEKKDAAKEEIKKILSKVDERKKKGRRRVEKKKKEDEEYDDGEDWNDDDFTDWGPDASRGKKLEKSSDHLFRCPHTECGVTFAKEVP